MVHIETPKVKVLRASQKNAKKTLVPRPCHTRWGDRPTRHAGLALNPKPLGPAGLRGVFSDSWCFKAFGAAMVYALGRLHSDSLFRWA